MMIRKIRTGLLFLFINFAAVASAQSLDQARKLYNDGDYAAAKPVFEKYIKISPRDASYNLWYGVCLYETGELEAAENYISFAASRKVQEAYRYLAQICFRTYRFNEAAEAYSSYIDLLKKKKGDTALYEEQLDLAKKASRMLDNTEDIQIIDSMIVDKDEILSAYRLSPESGELQYFDDFFESDRPDPGNTIHLNQRADQVLFSVSKRDVAYDLYLLNKNMDGWADNRRLPDNINSERNEKYPFVLTDGITLYFASDKKGSIGGYDLYVTRLNTNTGAYLNPEQLGMPFNSVYNDYLMVIDEVKGVGWFASDRFQDEGKAVVYTFIPNNSKKAVVSDDMAYKRDRAKITSIEGSWNPQADYSALRKKARTAVVREEQKKDFTFVINDQTTYHTLEEFKDEGARNLYIKAQQTRESLEELSKRLQKAREAYAKGSHAQQAQLKSSILEMETQKEQLITGADRLEVQARNTEIKLIDKK